MKLVVIESPYSPSNGHTLEENVEYARAAMRDSLDRGEAPYASHLLYTQDGVLDDTNPRERNQGMLAGSLWGDNAELTAVYADLGITKGMEMGMRRASHLGRPIEVRYLK